MKIFSQNLIAGIREFRISEKSFYDYILQKINQLRECELYDSGEITTENDTFLEDHDIVCTSLKQKHDCYLDRKMIVIRMKLRLSSILMAWIKLKFHILVTPS